MPSFSGMMSSLTAAAKQPVSQAGFDLKSALNFSKTNMKAQAQYAVGRAAHAGVAGVLGAATQAISGDPAGALKTLGSVPGSMFNKALGITDSKASGGTQFAAPGEGNALYGINARRDAVLNFNWFAVMPSIGGAPSLPWYYCESASLSWRVIEIQSIYRRSHQEHLPKSYSVPNLRLGFMIDDSMNTMDYLMAWQDRILDPFNGKNSSQGNWGRPADFWKPIKINVLSVNKQTVMTVTYHEAWPINVETLNLVSSESGRLMAEVDFAVNDVSYEFQPAGNVAASNSGLYRTSTSSLNGSVNGLVSAVTKKALGFATSGLSTISPSLARGVSKLLG